MSKLLFLAACLALSAGATAQTLVATIPVGNNPDAVAVDRTTNLIFAVNVGDNSVSVINGASNRVVATVPVGTFPQAVAVNRALSRVYVGNLAGTEQLSVINDQTGKVRNVKLSNQTGVTGVTADTRSGNAYVCNAGSDIVAVNGTTNQVLATIAVPQCGFGLGTNSRTNFVFAATFTPNITVINSITNQVSALFPLDLTGAVAVAVDVNTNRLGVVDGNAGVFEVLEASNGAVLGSINGLLRPFGAVYQPGARIAFVAEQNGNDLAVLDTVNMMVKTRVTVGTQPLGVDYNATTHLVYVANYLSNTVSVISVPGV